MVGIHLQKGTNLYDALMKNSCPFNTMTIALLQVGYESGKLADTTYAIAQYLTTLQSFYKNMRHALYMPLITFIFVLLLIIGIFVYVIPYLLGLFASFNTQLPPSTALLIRISTYMRSWYSIGIMIGSIGISSIIRYCIYYFPYCKHYWDATMIHTPWMGIIIKEWYIASIMRALGTLIESNMTVSQALIIIQPMIHNHTILHEWVRVTQLVEAGSSLTDALASTQHDIFESDLIAMVAVGEESNKLADFLYKIAAIYHERLINRLNRISSLMQPMAIIILGLVVMILIIAVYMPIIQMAHHIQ
jgi:type II secretory pathway component PulF